MQPPTAHKPLYAHLYFQVLVAIAIGVALGYFYPALGDQDEAAGRRLHQADQDDDRADHLHHGRGRHREDGRHEEGRPGRHQGPDLFRGGHDPGPGDRPGRGQRRAAGRRDQRRREHTRYEGASPATQRGANRSRRSSSCCTSSPTRSWARSPAARSFRCCSSRSCSAWRWRGSGRRGDRWSISSIKLSHVLFDVIGIIMRVAPIGAFGAMAFTIGKYGLRHARLAGQADGVRLHHLFSLRVRRPGTRSPASPGFASGRSCATSRKRS